MEEQKVQRAAIVRDERLKWLLRRRARAGVTLVEVLIVVGIMAMIAGGVAFALLPAAEKASIKTARKDATGLKKMVELWVMDSPGECPTVGVMKRDKLLAKESGKDPWGKTYKISCEGTDIHVTSVGPDGKKGTEDDITVPSAEDEAIDEEE
jgi:general secretion pathway protein G